MPLHIQTHNKYYTTTCSACFSTEQWLNISHGRKQYELINHLGNVLATLTDKLIGIDTNNNQLIDYYSTDLATQQSYYPFGSLMPGRTYTSSSNYRFGFGGHEKDDEISGNGNHLSFGDYGLDTRLGRRWTPDPKFSKFPYLSPYSVYLNNPVSCADPDGEEPIKPQAGTVAGFINFFNNTRTQMGILTGAAAADAMLRLGKTEMNWKQMRPLPATTAPFNLIKDRYIYTEKGGWIDMAHFLFYAGSAYNFKVQKETAIAQREQAEKGMNDAYKNGGGYWPVYYPKNPIEDIDPMNEALKQGYQQEMTDRFAAPYSAYSYEDLPSDKFGAEFATKYFDPNSKLNFGEQISNYLNNVLGATTPDKAPNYDCLPDTEPTDKPTSTNQTTTPNTPTCIE